MKNIVDYTKRILAESFQSSILNDMNDEVNSVIKKDKEHNEQIKKEEEEKGEKNYSWRFVKNAYPIRNLLKEIGVKWSDVKDEDFDEYTDIEEAIKLGKRMASERSNTFSGVIIPVKDETIAGVHHQYQGILSKTKWSCCYVSLISTYYRSYGRNENCIKPKDIEDYLRNCKKVYILNLSKHPELSSWSLQGERRNAKAGMEERNEHYYETVAKSNRERYEKLAAKMKQDKYADDGIVEKVKRYTEASLTFTQEFSKNPLKYSSYEYKIKNYLEVCANLITAYSSYLKTKLSLASGKSYDFERKGYEKEKQSISLICKDLDKKMEALEDEINKAS